MQIEITGFYKNQFIQGNYDFTDIYDEKALKTLLQDFLGAIQLKRNKK